MLDFKFHLLTPINLENMKISITSVLVNDQERAIKFYTDILGFEIKTFS